MIEIKYHTDVLLYLDELTDILIDKGYFSFYEDSVQYIEELIHYVRLNIGISYCRAAPVYFSKYGDDLLYITYRKSRYTMWYIFFQKYDNLYFIRHITNNHVAAQYFT